MSLDCPNCRVDLVMSERHGIEIDYCPKCRGVWLDRGELDKIIERADGGGRPAPAGTVPPNAGLFGAPAAPARPAPAAQVAQPGYPPRYDTRRHDDDDDDDDRRKYGHHSGYPKKKKSWLSDIFD
jgi:hypothetical protein